MTISAENSSFRAEEVVMYHALRQRLFESEFHRLSSVQGMLRTPIPVADPGITLLLALQTGMSTQRTHQTFAKVRQHAPPDVVLANLCVRMCPHDHAAHILVSFPDRGSHSQMYDECLFQQTLPEYVGSRLAPAAG